MVRDLVPERMSYSHKSTSQALTAGTKEDKNKEDVVTRMLGVRKVHCLDHLHLRY